MSSITCAVFTAAGPPTVSISPVAEQVIPTGGSVTLTCSAEDCVSSSFTYMWYRDGVSVSSSAVLNITNVSSTTYGRHECKATGSGGTGSVAKTIARESKFLLLNAPVIAKHGNIHAMIRVNHCFFLSCS